MNQDLNIINEYLSKAPAVVRETILSSEWTTKINDIARKYSLNPDQSSSLGFEVLFVALGIEPEGDLKVNLENNLPVSSLLAEQLALDIEQRVFSWIDKVYNAKSKGDSSQKKLVTETPKVDYTAPVPEYAPRPQVVMDTEFVQAPVPVPRFKAVPLSDNEIGQNFIPNIAPKPSAGGIMGAKLKAVSDTLGTEAPKPAQQKYSSDPYREPLA